MKVSRVAQVAIQSMPDAAGWGFSIGDRFSIALAYRTQDGADAARRAVLKAVNDAAETVERWNPAKR